MEVIQASRDVDIALGTKHFTLHSLPADTEPYIYICSLFSNSSFQQRSLNLESYKM